MQFDEECGVSVRDDPDDTARRQFQCFLGSTCDLQVVNGPARVSEGRLRFQVHKTNIRGRTEGC